MEQLRAEFGGAGFEVIAVNVDETPADGPATGQFDRGAGLPYLCVDAGGQLRGSLRA